MRNPRHILLCLLIGQWSSHNLILADRLMIAIQSPFDIESIGKLGGVLLEPYENFVLAEFPPSVEKTALKAGGIIPLRKIHLDRVRIGNQTLLTQGGKTRLATQAGRGPEYYIVQFKGPVKESWTRRVVEMGAQLLQYYPDNAYVVRVSPETAEKIKEEPVVRWIGAYAAEWKLAPTLKHAVGRINNVQVVLHQTKDTPEIVEQIQAMGAKRVQQYGYRYSDSVNFDILEFSAPAEILPQLTGISEVQYIDTIDAEWGLEDEISGQINSGNYAEGLPYPGYMDWLAVNGVDGEGVRWAVVDTGCDTNDNETMHQDLRGRVPNTIFYSGEPHPDTSSHGTHVAGIIAGNAATQCADLRGFLMGLGAAPKSELICQVGSGSSSGRAPIITRDGLRNGAVGSNSSWHDGCGAGGCGYNTSAAVYDSLVRDGDQETEGDQPYIIVFSAGNAGPNPMTLTSPHEAKNIITVGSSLNYPRNVGGAIDRLARSSSRGPARDGRYAPTVVAPGASVSSARSYASRRRPDPTCPDSTVISGTSMAAPQVSGSAALITQWWRNYYGGTQSPAMTKALLVNGATDMAPGGPEAIPSNDQGWGRINLSNVVNNNTAMVYHDQDTRLTATGDALTYRVTIDNASKPFKVTLAWTDVPGAPGSEPALVNDLDLIVSNGKETFLGNVFMNGWSVDGGETDALNNTENVYLPPGTVGTWTITVMAANLAGKAHVAQETYNQDFALVVYNAVER